MTNLKPPAHSELVKVAFPVPHVLLLSFNRPLALNAMSRGRHADMKAVLDWFENEPELWYVALFYFTTTVVLCLFWRRTMRQWASASCHSLLLWVFFLLSVQPLNKVSGNSRVAVLTGEGRLFCAGADLKGYVCAAHRFLLIHAVRYYSLHIGHIENTLIFSPF